MCARACECAWTCLAKPAEKPCACLRCSPGPMACPGKRIYTWLPEGVKRPGKWNTYFLWWYIKWYCTHIHFDNVVCARQDEKQTCREMETTAGLRQCPWNALTATCRRGAANFSPQPLNYPIFTLPFDEALNLRLMMACNNKRQIKIMTHPPRVKTNLH